MLGVESRAAGGSLSSLSSLSLSLPLSLSLSLDARSCMYGLYIYICLRSSQLGINDLFGLDSRQTEMSGESERVNWSQIRRIKFMEKFGKQF